MLNHLFQSVFQLADSSTVTGWFLLSFLISLGLGAVLAYLYRYQEIYSREFAMTLVVLPSLIAVVIFLVNGNLGTSVAVAGAFSLIKFRSPASSSKELLLVFMATAVGLAAGMGYILLAVVITLLISGVLLVLERLWIDQKHQQWQEITVAMPKQAGSRQHLEALLAPLGSRLILEKISGKRDLLELTYLIRLDISDQEVIDYLLALHPSWTVSLSKTVKKKKSL